MSVPNLSLITLLKADFLHPFFDTHHFFSLLMDSTTDSGSVKDELIIVLYCKRDDVVKEIKPCARYLSVITPDKANSMDWLPA